MVLFLTDLISVRLCVRVCCFAVATAVAYLFVYCSCELFDSLIKYKVVCSSLQLSIQYIQMVTLKEEEVCSFPISTPVCQD